MAVTISEHPVVFNGIRKWFKLECSNDCQNVNLLKVIEISIFTMV
jgi:hypothetical protein